MEAGEKFCLLDSLLQADNRLQCCDAEDPCWGLHAPVLWSEPVCLLGDRAGGQKEVECAYTPHSMLTRDVLSQHTGSQLCKPALRLVQWAQGIVHTSPDALGSPQPMVDRQAVPSLRGVPAEKSRTQQGADRQVKEETDVQSM